MKEMSKKKVAKIQLILLGNTEAGKSSILRYLKDGTFLSKTYTTIGVDFISKTFTIDDQEVFVKIWDTAGQERFHTIAKSYYRHCQGALLVFDVNDHDSFTGINKWISNVNAYANTKVIKYLVGNKIDKEDHAVTNEEAKKFAKSKKLKYYETSAKTGQNISEVILDITSEVYHTYQEKKKTDDEFELNADTKNKSKDKCC